ncbi:unnamed protein product [Diamesa hyperborea]
MLRVSLVFVAIVAVNLIVKCDGKAFFFPFAFHFKREHTNDGLQKTLTYASPFTGKTYKLGWDSNWMFKHGSNVDSTNVTTSTTTVKPKILSHVGPKDIHVKWEWNFNKGLDTTTTIAPSTTTTTRSTTSTTTTTTEKPVKIQEEDFDQRDAFEDGIQTDDKSNDIDPTSSHE